MYAPPTPAPMAPAPRKSGSIVAVIIVVLLAAGIGGFLYLRNADTEDPEARVGRLIREASGSQPVKTGFIYNLSKMKKFDDTFRDLYKNLFRINQDYIAAVKGADISAVSTLGTPTSFADPSTVSEGLRQLHAVYDLDMNQEQKVKDVVEHIHELIQTGDWASSDREGIMKGFDAGLSVPLAKRQSTVAAEQAWVQSIDDVYSYAQQNHSVFVLNEGQLLISDNDVLQNFNSKLQTMNSRRTEFIQAKDDYDKFQAETLRKMGVSPKDMGMQ